MLTIILGGLALLGWLGTLIHSERARIATARADDVLRAWDAQQRAQQRAGSLGSTVEMYRQLPPPQDAADDTAADDSDEDEDDEEDVPDAAPNQLWLVMHGQPDPFHNAAELVLIEDLRKNVVGDIYVRVIPISESGEKGIGRSMGVWDLYDDAVYQGTLCTQHDDCRQSFKLARACDGHAE